MAQFAANFVALAHVFGKFRQGRFNAKTAHGKPSPSRDCRLRIPGWGEVAGSVSGSFEEEDWERLQQGGGGPRVPRPRLARSLNPPVRPLALAGLRATRHVWKRRLHTPHLPNAEGLQKSSNYHLNEPDALKLPSSSL